VHGDGVRVAQRRRQHDREVRLTRLGAHRGEVGQRAGERAPADVLRRGLAEPEVRAVDHHVGRDRRGAAGGHDRAVVTDPAHHARPGTQREHVADRG
jgi:hypothetical protein